MSEKVRLIPDESDDAEVPLYGTYNKESSNHEKDWENRKKRHQLGIIVTVIVILALLTTGVVLAITLPRLLQTRNRILDPKNPDNWDIKSSSVLGIYNEAGVSSEDSICSDIGRDILKNFNGSAVDAAIATTLCLGVVRPQSSGLGGGLFMVIYSDGEIYGINGRETVPANADPAIYNNDPLASVKGGLAVGIPGELNALWTAHQKFGNVDWAELVKPAKNLAKSGFTIGNFLAKKLQSSEKVLQVDPVLRSEFINPATGKVWITGDTLKRPRLARTLELLETEGISTYHNGTLASNILADLKSAGSMINEIDLMNYSAQWATPLGFNLSIHNLTLFCLPFPSSGPVITMGLGILEKFGKKAQSSLSQDEQGLDTHYLIEALKYAETHRSRIGDLKFDKDNELLTLMETMISEPYITELHEKISDNFTQNNASFYGPMFAKSVDMGTSHVSIIGPNGDAVSLTSSINSAFGAGFMGNLTGIIFNNQLNDFSFPNQTDLYGLSPNPRNFVEPGKQPASSMSPIIIINADGLPVLVSGGSGGPAIISAVISTTWRALYRTQNIKESIDFPRVVIKMNPTNSTVLYEYGFPNYVLKNLEQRGHMMERISINSTKIGNVDSVCRTKESHKILGNADYRKDGGSSGF